MNKKEAIDRLRPHLAKLFDVRFTGTDGASLARMQGYADGYMQALGDLAVLEDRELLSVVNDERRACALRAEMRIVTEPSGPAVADFA
jgi:hypothetical protein